jgi:hypothetical protein
MEIRIYVEGGGDQRAGKDALQRGISQFLNPIREMARKKRISFRVIACGSRNSAFGDFDYALRSHPEAINILLIDAEGLVHHANPWEHLRQRDPSWDIPNLPDTQCFLMAQAMEAWVIADINALRKYHGQGFNANPFPGNPDIESFPKERLERVLIEATRNNTKGTYHKLRHGPDILARADHTIVCERASHCRRLFATLQALIVLS